MPTYKLLFLPSSRKEWDKLGEDIRRQFTKKLTERLMHPRTPSARLHGMPDCYKIKLRTVGYRLIYRVDDGVLTVLVIAVGKRDNDEAYKNAARRL